MTAPESVMLPSIGRPKELSVVLTIAGSDSGGGAGIQADVKTFASLGVHGASVITCVTAQNPRRVRALHPCDPRIVRRQIEAVFEELPPAAVKTGLLFSGRIVRVVADFFKRANRPPLVVDPVMIATSGRRLLEVSGVKAMKSKLLPLAALVTPNLYEAGVLAGRRVESVEGMRAAARLIKARYGCAVVVKGGHLPAGKEAVDIFYDGRVELALRAPFVMGMATHGTGCAYSAAIVAWLALGYELSDAVERAKQYISDAIAGSATVCGHPVLNHFRGGSQPAGRGRLLAKNRVKTRLGSPRR